MQTILNNKLHNVLHNNHYCVIYKELALETEKYYNHIYACIWMVLLILYERLFGMLIFRVKLLFVFGEVVMICYPLGIGFEVKAIKVISYAFYALIVLNLWAMSFVNVLLLEIFWKLPLLISV